MHYFFGFSLWKHGFVKPFFSEIPEQDIIFINPVSKIDYFDLAIKKGMDKNSYIYIWGKKSFVLVEEFALKNNMKIYRVEDGFIRSVGLGSDLTQAYSLVVDSRGIYFDPTSLSDLEHILKTTVFDEEILNRAKKIRKYLIEKKLSKYNLYENKKLDISTEKKIVLVPGQVEDDASIRFGATGMTNLELLKSARKNAKDSYIIYKPHPDVLVGNRVGNIDENVALKYADSVVSKIGIDSVLEVCDEVHTMTSLVGFEALMREKKVFTYGMPFYAGWGLTDDKVIQSSRERKISLDELVSATLILYPSYINPLSLKKCEVEELLITLDKQKQLYDASWGYGVKIQVRNYISRKLQQIFRLKIFKN